MVGEGECGANAEVELITQHEPDSRAAASDSAATIHDAGYRVALETAQERPAIKLKGADELQIITRLPKNLVQAEVVVENVGFLVGIASEGDPQRCLACR